MGDTWNRAARTRAFDPASWPSPSWPQDRPKPALSMRLFGRSSRRWILAALTSGLAVTAHAETVRDVRKKMGSRFEITAVHADPELAERAIDRAYGEIDRIESMISSWRPTSVTSEINRQAGRQPVAVPEELFNLMRRSIKLSELTGGAFDVTFAGVGRLWDFKAEVPRLPEGEEIRRALAHVGYKKIVLDAAERTIFLDDSEARIGFGAIGKGHAANRAVFVLKAGGIESGVVSAGGDLVAFGHKEDGSLWDIGIAHPLHRDQVFARLPLSEQAVVTSGDYESFITIDGKRYAHILDPRTGYPVADLRSVTIVCPDAELADGLATAVFVLGPDEGLKLINALRGIEGLLVGPNGELLFSDRLRAQLQFPEEEKE